VQRIHEGEAFGGFELKRRRKRREWGGGVPGASTRGREKRGGGPAGSGQRAHAGAGEREAGQWGLVGGGNGGYDRWARARKRKERKRKRIQFKFETDISNLFKLDSIQTGPFPAQKIWNKTFVEAESLNDQERHLALEMPTLRMAHVDRERENTHAKQHQGKAWATKAQQDLLVNMVINNRLLICKA
jgi:hypothetical protein